MKPITCIATIMFIAALLALPYAAGAARTGDRDSASLW